MPLRGPAKKESERERESRESERWEVYIGAIMGCTSSVPEGHKVSASVDQQLGEREAA